MASWKTDFEGAAIVLLGTFNPAIFQPAWMGAHQLLRDEEVESANIALINPRITSFSADWLTVQVLQERFQATTNNPAHYQALKDLVIGTFEILEHTPFWTMGMNRDMHFKVGSEEKWHRLGDLLAPKEVWRRLLEQPGLRSLLMNSAPSTHGSLRIVRNVRIEPSAQFAPGVYIHFNLEATVPDAEKGSIIGQQEAARELLEYLGNSWSDMLVEGQMIADHLMSQV